MGTAAASITRTLNGTTKLNTGRAGRCVDFVATGDWLSYGPNPALQLSILTGLAVVETSSSPSSISTIFNTSADTSSAARGFLIRVETTGAVTVIRHDVAAIGTTTGKVKLGGISNIAWSYNNVSGLLRIAIDGVIESFTSAQALTHSLVTRNRYYDSNSTQAGAHKQYLFALSAECDRVTNDELIAWSNNPWSIFKAPGRIIAVPTVGGGEVTGTVAYTNVDDTSAAAASPAITGSSATTNADDISAANAVGAVTGSSATTNLDDASAASAAPVVTASSATTNADDVSNASAAVGSEVTATVAFTNADDTSAATASPVASASSSTTNADDISAASAAPIVTASAENTNADDVSDASAAVGSEVVGSVAYTNIDDVSDAAATVTVPVTAASVNADDSSNATLKATITASVAVTNSNDISSAFSGAVVDGSVAVTNADDVSVGNASPVASLSSATTNADDVSNAEAVAEAGEIIASVNVVNADDISSAVAAPVITASIAYSNLHDLSAAIAEINFGTIVEALLTTGIIQDTRIKKPGIPSDAPEWQRTMFEIFTGRRGNKIDVAKFQALTFSATPTQAECEALYGYLNEVRQSMDQLIKRFDS